MTLKLWLVSALVGIIVSHAAWGQDRGPPLEDYNHAVWTAKDGAPLEVNQMAQTPDGWLWLGTPTGLYRFDGLRFYPFAAANGVGLLGTKISRLLVDPNGDLYIGYEQNGFSVLRADGRLEHLAPAGMESPVHNTRDIVRDIDGSLWVTTVSGLMHLEHGRWSKIEISQGFRNGQPPLAALDANGQLWAVTPGHVFRYDRARRRFSGPLELPDWGSNYYGLTRSPDGRLWSAGSERLTAISWPAPGAAGTPDYARLPASDHFAIFDRAGNLWSLRCPTGVCLAAAAGATAEDHIDVGKATTSRLDQPWQLSSLTPSTVFADREGNVWLGTPTGIERFRANPLRPVRLPPTPGTYHVAPDDGSAWVVAPRIGKRWHYDPASRRLTEAPGSYRGAALAPDGTPVFLKADGISVRRGGVETHIGVPALPPGAWVRADGDHVWLGGMNVPVQLWDGKRWQPLADLPSNAFVFSSAGRHGQMWRGLVDGRLLLYEGGRRTAEYDQTALGGIGPVTCLSAAPELVVGGEAGVAVMHAGRFRRLSTQRDEVLRNVSGFLVSADGSRWMNGRAGLLRISAGDWRRAVDTGAPLQYELLDVLDGYPGAAANVVPSLRMVNGRLWVFGSGGVVEIDPAWSERNGVAPQPALLALTGDDLAYPVTRPPRIRAGTTRLRFDFTAPMLRKPERIVFSYRLDGVDQDWQTGTERSATYAGLSPGDYRFRVRAMNEDGVWSKHEHALDLHVAPTLVQTVYFKLAIALASLWLLWFGYRLRLRFLTRTLTERLRAQIEERERIARELHDTVLQTFQSVVLKIKAILPDLDGDSILRATLEGSLREANAAIEEGRDKVKALRVGGRRELSLPDYLREVGEREGVGEALVVRCDGQVRPLQPVVEQELCAIGREALRNAFRHAQGQRYEAIIEFDVHVLVLIIRDDGRGIDAAAREKPDHWGLRGIEERARRIHADARLYTGPGAGTTWRIEVNTALAYVDKRPRWRRPWRR